MPQPQSDGGMVQAGHCFECNKEIDMATAVADPNGHPLCRDCFNALVRVGHKSDDVSDLV